MNIRRWALVNLMTVSRPLLVFLGFRIWGVTENHVPVAVLSAVAVVLDVADGWLARNWQVVSGFGKALDPIADLAQWWLIWLYVAYLTKDMYGLLISWLIGLGLAILFGKRLNLRDGVFVALSIGIYFLYVFVGRGIN